MAKFPDHILIDYYILLHIHINEQFNYICMLQNLMYRLRSLDCVSQQLNAVDNKKKLVEADNDRQVATIPKFT